MLYRFTIHCEDAGFWAQCKELPGCTTQADTKEGLLINIRAALELYFDKKTAIIMHDLRTSPNYVTFEVTEK